MSGALELSIDASDSPADRAIKFTRLIVAMARHARTVIDDPAEVLAGLAGAYVNLAIVWDRGEETIAGLPAMEATLTELVADRKAAKAACAGSA
jgi:hypothetical protein